MSKWLWLLLVLVTPACAMGHAAAAAEASTPTDGLSCSEAIRAADRLGNRPAQLVQTIALVESGRLDAVDRHVRPWPWTINAAGIGHFYQTKADAIAAVAAFRAAGLQSLDVGCMQINLQQHPQAFASLDEAFDPATNVAYGVKFLEFLFRRCGDWPLAVASYHSMTPEIGAPYWDKVQRNWALGARYGAMQATAAAPSVPTDPNMTAQFAQRSREAEEDHRRLLRAAGLADSGADARRRPGFPLAGAVPRRTIGAQKRQYAAVIDH